MSKLYFYYSAMNAGKSTTLLQSSYNYQERGMNTLVLAPQLDTRAGPGKVASRIGLTAEARAFKRDENLFTLAEEDHEKRILSCVLVDEAQFLTRAQVEQLTDIADRLRVPVLCYGLRTDFQGNLFEGSQWLLAWADNLIELKTICHCGRKAIMVLRVDASGAPVKTGAQIEIGGNDRYVSVCRRHYKESQHAWLL